MPLEIALFYYPTQVAIVDDCSRFLEAIRLCLPQGEQFRTFGNVFDALSAINGMYVAASGGDSDKVGDGKLCVDATPASNNPGGKTQRGGISVIAVDYDMPLLNGIDFCKNIRDPNIKKILITGHALPQDVDAALRDRIVDVCIHKDDANFVQQLVRYVKYFQAEYFRSKSEGYVAERLLQLPFLYDSALADYFDNVCYRLEVVKYHYDPTLSGFVLMQKQGVQSVLLVYRDGEFNEQDALSHIPACLLPDILPGKCLSGRYFVEKITGYDLYWSILIQNIRDPYAAHTWDVRTRTLH